MIEPLDITYLEDAWDQFYNHENEYNEEGLDDLAHWLGGSAGLMLREIRILRTQVGGLQAALEEKGWIPVSPETMPEDRQRVLTYSPSLPLKWRIALQMYEEVGVSDLAWWTGAYNNRVVSEMDITHWMPLPLEVDE